MGAVPGSCVLSGRSTPDPLDVERYRSSAGRRVVVRRPARPAVVLGSTQPESVVDRRRAAAAGVAVLRRRSGGGAVLATPDDPLWLDVWVPRADPLFDDDVVAAALWVGRWWASALEAAGARDLAVHEGRSVDLPLARLVCFAGLGPGEVAAGGRKVVGVAQWRCRQGALFHACAYRRWDPRPLVDLLGRGSDGVGDPDAVSDHLGSAAVGTLEVTNGSFALAALLDRLPPGPAWDVASD